MIVAQVTLGRYTLEVYLLQMPLPSAKYTDIRWGMATFGHIGRSWGLATCVVPSAKVQQTCPPVYLAQVTSV